MALAGVLKILLGKMVLKPELKGWGDVCAHMSVHVSLYLYMCLCRYVSVHLCLYMRLCASVCVCMYRAVRSWVGQAEPQVIGEKY